MKRYYFTVAAILVLILGGGIGVALIASSSDTFERVRRYEDSVSDLARLSDQEGNLLDKNVENGHISAEEGIAAYGELISTARKNQIGFKKAEEARGGAVAEMRGGMLMLVCSVITSIMLGAKAVRAKDPDTISSAHSTSELVDLKPMHVEQLDVVNVHLAPPIESLAAKYYLRMGVNIDGPFSINNIRELVKSGALDPDSMVKKDEDLAWQPLAILLSQEPIPAPMTNTSVQEDAPSVRRTLY